jgi:hypothetical protein
MEQASLDLIVAMRDAAKAAQPITGRGIGYKLFTRGLIPSMDKPVMKRVYRLLKLAREQGMIPWHWIVDETRELEQTSTWADPAEYAEDTVLAYRRDFWLQQPTRVQVWSEKGTVRGVLDPVLDKYAVGFLPVHGFNSATSTHSVCQDKAQPLVILYVGDYDPSGMCMSEKDLPTRFNKYGGHHIRLRRIALKREHLAGLPSFPATDKEDDPRYDWFVKKYGKKCWELDAMDPNVLRRLVMVDILAEIELTAWERCVTVENAERDSLRHVLERWTGNDTIARNRWRDRK